MLTESQDSDAPQTEGGRLLTEDEWAAASTFCKQLASGLLAFDGERDSTPTVSQPERRFGISLPAYKPVNDQGERIASEHDVTIPAFLLPGELDQSTRGPSRQTAHETIAASEHSPGILMERLLIERTGSRAIGKTCNPHIHQLGSDTCPRLSESPGDSPERTT